MDGKRGETLDPIRGTRGFSFHEILKIRFAKLATLQHPDQNWDEAHSTSQKSKPHSPIVQMGETEAQTGSFALFPFLLPAWGLEVISGALAAILGHEATPRSEANSHREGAPVTRQIYT